MGDCIATMLFKNPEELQKMLQNKVNPKFKTIIQLILSTYEGKRLYDFRNEKRENMGSRTLKDADFMKLLSVNGLSSE